MIKAIVYTSKTGTTEWYAERIGKEKNLPVLTLKEAEKKLEKGSGIIYLGCIRADIISGLDKAKALFSPSVIVGGRHDKKRRKDKGSIEGKQPRFLRNAFYPPRRICSFPSQRH